MLEPVTETPLMVALTALVIDQLSVMLPPLVMLDLETLKSEMPAETEDEPHPDNRAVKMRIASAGRIKKNLEDDCRS